MSHLVARIEAIAAAVGFPSLARPGDPVIDMRHPLRPGEALYRVRQHGQETVAVVHADYSATQMQPGEQTVVRVWSPGTLHGAALAGKLKLTKLAELPAPPAAPEQEIVPIRDGAAIRDGVLHHQTGTVYPLADGDAVYQHRQVLTSFLIEHADGTMTKLDRGGNTKRATPALVAQRDRKYWLVREPIPQA